jgi:hypothetical protein
MNASQKRIIYEALVIELHSLQDKINRESYFIKRMWPFCNGKNSNTDDNFKVLNSFKNRQRLHKTRKTKVESAIKLIKSLK